MDRIIIKDIAGYNGEYDFDASYFTNKELHIIKKIANVRAGEIQEAFQARDSDLIVAFAAIALERNGKAWHEQVLWNAKFGSIEIEFADAEEDADPPTSGPEESSSENKLSSGPSSDDDSVSQENGLSRTGLQESELSAT